MQSKATWRILSDWNIAITSRPSKHMSVIFTQYHQCLSEITRHTTSSTHNESCHASYDNTSIHFLDVHTGGLCPRFRRRSGGYYGSCCCCRTRGRRRAGCNSRDYACRCNIRGCTGSKSFEGTDIHRGIGGPGYVRISEPFGQTPILRIDYANHAGLAVLGLGTVVPNGLGVDDLDCKVLGRATT
jgi:hypothetical protein